MTQTITAVQCNDLDQYRGVGRQWSKLQPEK